MTIIALSGKAATGKDTFADVLVKRYEFTKIAFADPLRNICARVFYLDPSMFIDRDKKDADMKRIYLDFHDIDAIRYIVENEWGIEVTQEAREAMEELHGRELNTPRDVLRCIGNMLRETLDKDIWINLALKKIKETKGKVVITDARFENERIALDRIGAILVLIKRNDNGQTVEHEFDLGTEDEYDVVFKNDGTLHAYTSEIDMWYKSREAEFQYYKVWRYE
jgi:hypothetical protein